MNLMNREKGTIRARENVHYVASQMLHRNTVLAMSNLLNANIDTGLMYAIGKTRARNSLKWLQNQNLFHTMLVSLLCLKNK